MVEITREVLISKLNSLTISEWICRLISKRDNVPFSTVTAVMMHNYSSATEALADTKINSVEISGFGKFIFHEKKAHKYMQTLLTEKANKEKILGNGEMLTELERRKTTKELEEIERYINLLKPRINYEQ